MTPVTAVVVSKMDRPIDDVVGAILPHVEALTIVKGHEGVSERWDAAAHAGNRVVFTCDDDAVVDVAAVIAAYRPGVVVCNMPEDRRKEYTDGVSLVGFGAIFDRELVDKAFRRYWLYAHHHGLIDQWNDDVFRSETDRIFTGLSAVELIDVPFTHCAAAFASDRMSQRPNHGHMLAEARKRIYAVRGGQ